MKKSARKIEQRTCGRDTGGTGDTNGAISAVLFMGMKPEAANDLMPLAA